LFAIIITISLFSQTYEITIHSQQNQMQCRSLARSDNMTTFALLNEVILTSNYYEIQCINNKIIEIADDGTIIKEKEIISPPGKELNCMKIIVVGDTLMVAGMAKNVSDSSLSLFYYYTDQNLLADSIVFFAQNSIIYDCNFIKENPLREEVLFICCDDWTNFYRSYIILVDYYGNVKHISNPEVSVATFSFYWPSENVYVLGGEYINAYDGNNFTALGTIFDREWYQMNIDEEFGIYLTESVLKNDSVWLTAGSRVDGAEFSQYILNGSIGLYEWDSSLTPRELITLPHEYKNNTVFQDCFVLSNEHTAFLAINSCEVDFENFEYCPVSSLRVVKMDIANSTVLWQKYIYCIEKSMPMQIIPTEDGGCVVGGFKHSPFQHSSMHAFIIKFDQYGNPAGTGNSREVSDFMLFPNPTSDYFFIQSSDNNIGDCMLTIYDVSGRVVLKGFSCEENFMYNVSHLKQGVYFVEIKSDNNNRQIRKLLKQ